MIKVKRQWKLQNSRRVATSDPVCVGLSMKWICSCSTWSASNNLHICKNSYIFSHVICTIMGTDTFSDSSLACVGNTRFEHKFYPCIFWKAWTALYSFALPEIKYIANSGTKLVENRIYLGVPVVAFRVPSFKTNPFTFPATGCWRIIIFQKFYLDES